MAKQPNKPKAPEPVDPTAGIPFIDDEGDVDAEDAPESTAPLSVAPPPDAPPAAALERIPHVQAAVSPSSVVLDVPAPPPPPLEPPPVDPRLDVFSSSIDRSHEDLNSARAAAKRLDEVMRQEAKSRSGRSLVRRPELPAMTREEEAARQPTRFRVLETIRIPRGASAFTLPAGKVIDSREYAIDALRGQGVKLEPLPA